MDFVFFGIQGSGKGTQAKKIAEEFGYDIFEAGGELRKIAASGSDLGNTVRRYIDAGRLVPHEIIMQVVKEAVLARESERKILFDGIPRDEDQMRDFDVIMNEANRDYTCIQILLDRQAAVERILGRAKKEGRIDDADRDIINKRMDTFEKKTVPVLETYERCGKLLKIDGTGSVDEVHGKLKTVIESVVN